MNPWVSLPTFSNYGMLLHFLCLILLLPFLMFHPYESCFLQILMKGFVPTQCSKWGSVYFCLYVCWLRMIFKLLSLLQHVCYFSSKSFL